MISAVLILMDRTEQTMDVSGAWVREVTPMLATTRFYSPNDLGSLSYTFDAEATGDTDKKQIRVSLR